jgi:protein-tyrosine-phosphatase
LSKFLSKNKSILVVKILTSFGRGMKVFTAGVLPGNGIPDTVFSVMEQNGYHLSHKKPVDAPSVLSVS